jgi:heme oxygenase
LHTTAERSGIVNDILRKKADRRGYAMLLRNLLPAYCAMENGVRHLSGDHPFNVFGRAELCRADRIVSDLRAIYGGDWERQLPLLESGRSYALDVEAAASGRGDGLIGHAYVRYFGDLSGGQVLKQMLAGALDLPASALSFYEFPGLDPQAFKKEMRDAIDAPATATRDRSVILREARRAFECNIGVSQEIQDNLAAAA